MDQHKFDPNDRPTVHYVDDEELAYLLLRSRQSHDFYHVVFNLPPTVLGEVALKLVEMLEFKLGGAAFAALGSGRIVLSEEERREYKEVYVPWAVRGAKERRERGGGSLLAVEWEKEFTKDIDELRERLAISPWEGKTGSCR